MPEWKQYQEDVARFFRELGLDAETDVTLQGVRTTHDVDVVVRSAFIGLAIIWIVECKSWRSRVPKEKVLALRQIVDDLGADRGFLMSESGYQSGALEAAHLANVHLTSLADLAETSRHDLEMAKLRRIHERVRECRRRYWALSKSVRIEYDLRGDYDPRAYSGGNVINAVEACTVSAVMDGFPVVYDELLVNLLLYSSRDVDLRPESVVFDTPQQLVAYLGEQLAELETRLARAEARVGEDGS